jgi:hypothetical protein
MQVQKKKNFALAALGVGCLTLAISRSFISINPSSPFFFKTNRLEKNH